MKHSLGALRDVWHQLRGETQAHNPLDHWSLAVWSIVFIVFYYAAALPLATASQSALAWSLVALLYLIQANFDRIERYTGEYLKLIRIIVIFLAVFVTLRYIIWRLTNTIGYHDPFSLMGAFLLLGAELYGIGIYFLGAFVNAFPIHRKPAPPA